MKKTIRINIGGFIYHIDEDAYQELEKYLKAIQRKFGNSEEGKEIINDIEIRIAELFTEMTNGNKQVINIQDINSIIEIMGNPDDFDDATTEDDAQETRQNEKFDNTQHAKPLKKIYRDLDNQVLGGVCSGLGNYLGIDPVVLRITFAVITFFYGTGAIVYLIFWIIIPPAKSTAQKLEMKGVNVNISNIEKTIREEFKNVKKSFGRFTGSSDYQNKKQKLQQFFDRAGDLILTFSLFVLRILVVVIGVVFLLFGLVTFTLLGSTVFFGESVFSPTTWGENSFSILSLLQVVSTDIHAHIGLIGIYLVLIVPIVLLIYAGIKLVLRIKPRFKYFGLTMLGLWIIGIVMAVITIGVESKNFRSSGQITNDYKVDTKNKTIYVQAANADLTAYINENKYARIDEFYIIGQNDKKQVYLRPKFDIVPTEKSTPQLSVMYLAHGKTVANAKTNAKEIIFDWQQKDSLLYLAPYISIPKGEKWRMHHLKIKLRIPVGTIVFLDESMIPVIYDIQNIQNMWDNDMVNKKWIMTDDGLSLYTDYLEKNAIDKKEIINETDTITYDSIQ